MIERDTSMFDEEVERIVNRGLRESMDRVTKEQHGEGCGCLSCLRGAVDDINSWIDWVSKGTRPDLFYTLDPQTRKIIGPCEEDNGPY